MKPEQEKIEEMAKDLEEAKYYALGTVGSLNNGFGGWYGKYMYNKGYRKASEVIDEFVERLKEKLDKFAKRDYEDNVPYYYADCEQIDDVIDDIADEMKQEVNNDDKN